VWRRVSTWSDVVRSDEVECREVLLVARAKTVAVIVDHEILQVLLMVVLLRVKGSGGQVRILCAGYSGAISTSF
jgi:hypothetical protein